MRVALLSTLEPAGDADVPRGLLRVGGRPVVEHQLAAGLAFGCERVLCLADGSGSELIALRRLAERSGLGFAVVASGHDLAREVAPQDELLVISGGLFAPASEIARLVAPGNTILVQPAEHGVAAGFERLDLDHADAGIMRVPGVLAYRLSELPSEWNPLSALLRIAAQTGVARQSLPERLARDGYWLLIRSEAEAQGIEPRWLRLHTSGAAVRGVGPWLAAALVQRLGPALLHAGTRPRLVTAASLLFAVAALVLGWIGITAIAFAFLGLSWVLHECAALLARIVRDSLPVLRRSRAASLAYSWLLDAAFVACCIRRLEQADDLVLQRLPAAFIALTVFGLLRLLPRLFPGRRWAGWLEDRLVIGMLLAMVSGTAVFGPALMAAALLMIGVGMAASREAPDAPATDPARSLA